MNPAPETEHYRERQVVDETVIIGAGLRSKEEPPLPSKVTNYSYQLGCPAQCATYQAAMNPQ
jgi:hypothetical protein